MEQQYREQMEKLRKEILDTIPSELLEASRNTNRNPHHIDAEIDRAMDFLDAHSGDDDKIGWKRKLMRFVVLKELVVGVFEEHALAQAKHERNPKRNRAPAPIDLPGGGKLEALLEDHPDLLEEMLLADGASGGNYAKAMEIYQEILEQSECVADPEHPVLHRLAVAIALVHASPVVQTNPVESSGGDDDDDDDDDVVDPVRRYLNYEIAYLEGDLDPDFDALTVFELRFVVDGDEPDEVAAWGRSALRTFRPDHVLKRDPGWLYAAVVRSDIPYGSSRVKDDEDRLHKYQNILRNGGVCGRRAFFGRFILRSFGIPTTARPSKGHAALCHWTPTTGEWVVNLGGKWGKGWTKTRYVKDLDFEATMRARITSPEGYPRVKLAQWIGDLFDETRVYGIHSEKGKNRDERLLLDLSKKSDVGLWYRLSLKVQESILTEPLRKNAVVVRKNRTKGAAKVENVIETCCRRKERAGACTVDGTTIRVPAASYANPRKTRDVTMVKGIVAGSEESDHNQQIYLPKFKAEGTTIMRGGSFKNPPDEKCQSGARLLSGGRGKYENWGFRLALTPDDGGGGEDAATDACPVVAPELKLELGGGGNGENDHVSMEFVYVPPGTFVMGGTSTVDGRFKCVEVPHHPVEITRGFYLGRYPVTQDQYRAVTGKDPSKSAKDPTCPVDNIGADDAFRFCAAASEATGKDLRLPTEAEWEYASRGSTSGTSAADRWWYGDDPTELGDHAWIESNSGGRTRPVGTKRPNPFGLHDMIGNVSERVSDTYAADYYAAGKGEPMIDPTGPSQGTKSKFRYELNDVPEAGRYELVADVCTLNPHQRLRVSTASENDNDDEGIELELPYTVGVWGKSDPVVVRLSKGKNTLRFWRDAPPQYGMSVREFVLTKAE